MTPPAAHVAETDLLDAIKDPGASKERVTTLTEALPEGPCSHASRWGELAADPSFEAWRRLAAYGVLVSRCIPYPAALDDFVRIALEPFGLSREDTSDATIAQNVPVERTPADRLLVATLPIETPIGPAAVYLVLERDAETVARAALSPASG